MFAYWVMFAFPALLAMATPPRAKSHLQTLALIFVFAVFVTLIGLRYRVGADWDSYQAITYVISFETVLGSLSISDPAFAVVTWVATRLGSPLDIYFPSIVCGAVLMIGVLRFGNRQPDSWLVICASVPYLLIVVGMGYVRQSAAIGLLLIAIIHFERGALGRSFFYFLFASLFHVSALSVLPLAAVAILRRHPIALVPVVIVGAGLFALLLQPRLEGFLQTYVQREYDSSGTLIRLGMNAVPSALFLIYRKRFDLPERSRLLWLQFSVGSLALVPAILITSSSTVIDRLGLYLIPIQLFVFGNLSTVASRTTVGRTVIVYVSVIYYATVLFIWLNYATHATSWLPYRFWDHQAG